MRHPQTASTSIIAAKIYDFAGVRRLLCVRNAIVPMERVFYRIWGEHPFQLTARYELYLLGLGHEGDSQTRWQFRPTLQTDLEFGGER